MRKIFLICMFMLTGCVSNNLIRPKMDACQYVMPDKQGGVQGNDCADHASIYEFDQSGVHENKKLYELHFVEFDDQGLFSDKRQMNNVLKSLNGRENVDVVIFIHGWHHNALADDENVLAFQRVLKKLAGRNPSRHIFGVLVGWRGESLKIDGLNEFIFWERKNTSIEVGRGQVAELFDKLKHESQGMKDSRLIKIGHSFGASVLLSATKSDLSRQISQGCSLSSGNKKNNGFTILVNPAIEAIHYFPIFEQSENWKNYCPTADEVPLNPVVAVFSSESDWATQKWFPIGRNISTFFENHKEIKIKNRGGIEINLSEYDMDVKTVGNYDKFITHQLHGLIGGRSESDGCLINPKKWSDVIVSPLGQGWKANFTDSGTVLTHLKNSPAFSPAWVVKVQDDVIGDHTEIWGSRFNCFLEELILLK